MKIAIRFCLLLNLFPLMLIAQTRHTGSWGDQGDGTYTNPILNADYSDPDVIQVNGKYYMVCSEFHFMGMPVLESDDMVNWRIITQIYHKMDFPAYDSNARYGAGAWAPSIRYHDGKFWVYFCSRHEGLFMSNAVNPAGPWSPLLLVKNVQGWEDPCPFWDDDGNAYLGHSKLGAGPIILHKMSPDGTRLLDDGIVIYTGPVAEGTKFYKLNGYYYLCIPEGGVGYGWQTALRSKSIYGPYERKVVLETGTTRINGPHQGALVATPEGQWWFYHFQATSPLGRIVHLQPVQWIEDWPFIGVDNDGNGIGEPVLNYKKPAIAGAFPITAPQSDDDFNSPQLGLQWETNHNPTPDGWSFIDHPGWLGLQSIQADSFMHAKNTLTQKMMGIAGQASTELDLRSMKDGQRTGLAVMSDKYDLLGIYRKKGISYLFVDSNGTDYEKLPFKGDSIYLQVSLDARSNSNQFYYSMDNQHFTPLGISFKAKWGFWKGSRLALFSYNDQSSEGTAYFNWFHYEYDGPKGN